ncbi:MAG: elongation factor Ts [Phycisphaerae bacterium]|nr:elongation factor Ts [Phycisphaerae bacterium]
MAEVNAAVVVKLRKMSGQGMMDCKKALEESGGDLEKAMELLRKKGLATLAKRADRETTEGRVVCKRSGDGKTVAMVSLCSETDFVSRNDDFIAAAEKLGEYALACKADSGVDALTTTSLGGKPYADVLTEIVSKTGEKIEIGDFARYSLSGSGVIGSYVHFNHKVGTMVQIETSGDAVSAAIQPLATDIAMHVTALKPIAVDKDGVDPEFLRKEREIAAEQVKGKPANMIDKIVDGKIAKFLKENCLVDQPFVKDDTKSVAQTLSDVAKAAGGTAKIRRFVRIEIG